MKLVPKAGWLDGGYRYRKEHAHGLFYRFWYPVMETIDASAWVELRFRRLLLGGYILKEQITTTHGD